MKTDEWPVTLKDAVARTIVLLGADDKKAMAKMKKDDAIMLHMSLGMHLRNAFGLHRGNEALLAACDTLDPDDASGVIIEAAIKALKKKAKK